MQAGRLSSFSRVLPPLAALVWFGASLAFAPLARSEDAAAWLARAAAAARSHNYVGTIVFQHGGRVETSRLTHLVEGGTEHEKLVNLDGPAREVIRSAGEVRCYYPDAKIVRIEPRTFRNVFPSLSPQQQQALAQYYDFRKAEVGRVAGLEAQAYVFEPKDGMRFGHKFWADRATGLLLKALLINEKGEVVEQFAFTDIKVGATIDPARGEAHLVLAAARLAGAARLGGRCGAARHRVGGHARAAGLYQDHRRLPLLARQARIGRASRVLRRHGRGERVRRATGLGPRASRRRDAPGRPQRLHHQARRPSGDGAGRGAGRHRAPDRTVGRAPGR